MLFRSQLPSAIHAVGESSNGLLGVAGCAVILSVVFMASSSPAVTAGCRTGINYDAGVMARSSRKPESNTQPRGMSVTFVKDS